MELLVAGGAQQEAFAVALATDGLLCIVDTLAALADQATKPQATPPQSQAQSQSQALALSTEEAACKLADMQVRAHPLFGAG